MIDHDIISVFELTSMIRDVKEIEESTLWEETGRQMATRGKGEEEDPRKIVVIVLGGRGTGKSSIIKTLRNDFDPDTKPNSLIEYWPSKVGLDKKQLVHFYEFGNPSLAALAKFFCGKEIKLYFMICLDMTQGNQLIAQSITALKQISEICKGLKVEPQSQQKVRLSHSDSDLITSVPVPTMIVGCKFDLYEKLDQQSKKWVSRAIRYVSHTNSCSLLMSSNKNPQTSLAIRAAFTEITTKGILSSRPNFKDFTKPLFSNFGDDNISEMSLPSSGNLSTLDMLQKHLESIGKRDSKADSTSKSLIPGSGRLVQALQKRRNDLAKTLRGGENDVQLV